VDIDTISKNFSENLKQLVNLYKGGTTELKDMIQFMHFCICRHIVQRKRLGVVEYTLDENNKLLSAKTVSTDTSPLREEFLKDIDYSPIYYHIWGSSDPVNIPPIEDLNGKQFNELGKMLNTDASLVELVVNDEKNEHIFETKDNKVYFKKNQFPEFRTWINDFNDLFEEASNLAVFMVENKYSYDLDDEKELGAIIMTIYKNAESIYHELLEDKDHEVKNFPSEMKEVMSLIYMITASQAFAYRQ